MVTIYRIVNPVGQIYVGKTNNLRKRKNGHKVAAKKEGKRKDTILYASINKYGFENHKFEIIEQVESLKGDEREIFWIKDLKTYHYENPNGLNMTIGGIGRKGTWIDDIELRNWYSERYRGEGGPFYGKKHTEEAKRIISEKNSIRNKELGITIPEWGAEKGRLKVIKPVLCYDKKGKFITEFTSMTEASIKMNVHRSSVSESCNGIITGVEGKYIFKYKESNDFPLLIEVGKIKKKGEKRAVLYLDSKRNIIKEYASSADAARELKLPKTTINRAACYNKYKPIRTGHIFIYKDMYRKSKK